MFTGNQFDIANFDYRAATPEQVHRLKQQAMENARIERARAMRALFGGLMSRLRRAAAGAKGRALRLAFTVAARAASRWTAYRRWSERRTAVVELHKLSDRDLRDIGLRRSEIYGAVYGHLCDETVRPRGGGSPKPELALNGSSRRANLKPAPRKAAADQVRIKSAA